MKVGTIVEEATRINNRSGKSSEDERREAEEKVLKYIFQGDTIYVEQNVQCK